MSLEAPRQGVAWPGHGQQSDAHIGMMLERGGLFGDQQLKEAMLSADFSTRAPPSSNTAGLITTQSEFSKGTARLDATTASFGTVARPETPILAYVDRANFPGFVEPDQLEQRDAQVSRDSEVATLRYWTVDVGSSTSALSKAADASAASAGRSGGGAALADDQWEAELLEWKRKYGCPIEEDFSRNAQDAAAAAVQEHAPEHKERFDQTLVHPPRPPSQGAAAAAAASAAALAGLPARGESPCRFFDGEQEVLPPKTAPAAAAILEAPPGAAAGDATTGARGGSPCRFFDGDAEVQPPATAASRQATAAAAPEAGAAEIAGRSSPCRFYEGGEEVQPPPTSGRFATTDAGQASAADMASAAAVGTQAEGRSSPLRFFDGSMEVQPPPTAAQHNMSAASAAAGLSLDVTQPTPAVAAAAGQPGAAVLLPAYGDAAVSITSSMAAAAVVRQQPVGAGGTAGDFPVAGSPGPVKRIFEADLQVVKPGAPPPESPGPRSRRQVYTENDLEVATTSAKERLMNDGSYKTEYSEAGLANRDFFQDLRKQRHREKGRQATGPIWVHLAAQAKNLAHGFSLEEILEAFKLFCSVRYEDYELYMRLLGEVPHYVKLATADQLCELIRLLARRRLRERNYIDMVAAHLLGKVRITDDHLPARLLVKTANAFASLECRSQPKFVEHFLRHMEHRINELDAELCCLLSTLFVSSYMTDALRRAYLKRCAETNAGFHNEEYDMLRNLACTELVMRKEHHSFIKTVPQYVTRYLEKVKNHAYLDGWASVTLPMPLGPDGPKGQHRADLSNSLQAKASSMKSGRAKDVFSSDMHRDVSACLNHLGIEHENGVLCGPFLLDVVALDMVNPSKRIVYEVNAPHHYYEGTETVVVDKRLRQRMLSARCGQKLHVVHAHDWRALSSAQKMNHLLKLQQAQQEENSLELRQQAAANTARAPLPVLSMDAEKNPAFSSIRKPEPFRLKSARDLSAPIRVPVPPSQRPKNTAPRPVPAAAAAAAADMPSTAR
eukprot:TRINITY_DN25272_c0_g1_i1.p1 TRINITY_DN25272_c0_g1~~TRINITY_DN25272_c0_g1_i1.p1  ORF type:complete len:1091 (-),score=277.20 TRINITY_DN25272_c0_g1_i1:66-3098(-)